MGGSLVRVLPVGRVQLLPSEVARNELVCDEREQISSDAATEDVHDIDSAVLDNVPQQMLRRKVGREDTCGTRGWLAQTQRAQGRAQGMAQGQATLIRAWWR